MSLVAKFEIVLRKLWGKKVGLEGSKLSQKGVHRSKIRLAWFDYLG